VRDFVFICVTVIIRVFYFLHCNKNLADLKRKVEHYFTNNKYFLNGYRHLDSSETGTELP